MFIENIKNLLTHFEALEQAIELNHEESAALIEQEIMDLLIKNKDEVDNGVNYVKYVESQSELIDAEIERLKAFKKRYDGRIKAMKHFSMLVMKKLGIERLDGNLGRSFSLRKSQAVNVTNLSLLPNEYTRITTNIEPDKRLIADHLKRDIIVPGAELVVNESIQVR